MRWLLIGVLAVHGIIHLLGFAKAFSRVEWLPLTQPITRVRFSTPLRDYRDFGPLYLAGYGEARWHLADGDFVYGEFTMLDVVANDGHAATAP